MNRIQIWCIIVFVVIAFFVTFYFTHHSKITTSTVKPLGSQSNNVEILFNYQKDAPINSLCTFETPFTNPPVVFGNVMNQNCGSIHFTNSIFSVSKLSPSSFSPNIYQTWPIMGINWLALQEISVPGFEVGRILSPEMMIGPGANINKISFKSTFNTAPIVLLSPLSDDNSNFNREFGVYNVSSTSFHVTWFDSFDFGDSWAVELFYIAIDPTIDPSIILDSTSFVLEAGCTEYGQPPILDDWHGGIKMQQSRQYTPVVVSTMCFDQSYVHYYTKNIHMNTTIDTISRESFHVSINNSTWPINGRINWLAISMRQPTDDSQSPISVAGHYHIDEPRPTTTSKNFFFIETQIWNPPEATILINPVGIIRTTDDGLPTPNLIKVYEIQSDGFVIQINDDTNVWPTDSGVQYTVFERYPTSAIINKMLDQGVMHHDNISPDIGYVVINFNFEFNNIPKVFTAYNFIMDYPNQTRTAIVSVTKNYFVLQFAGFDYWNNRYSFDAPIHWVAIDDQTPLLDPMLKLEIRTMHAVNDIISSDYALTNNPRLQSVFGFFPIDSTKFNYPNAFINANAIMLDSVFTEFIHINTPMYIMDSFPELYPLHVLVIQPLLGQPHMNYKACEYQVFLDPACPLETIENDPASCPQITVAYLPKLDIDYFERETELAPETSGDYGSLNSDAPIDLDGVVLCNIYLKKETLEATSQYGCICRNSVNHLIKNVTEIGGYTQWLVNADYGYFSECKSVGNVLIRINSDFSSTNPVTLETLTIRSKDRLHIMPI
jgi:hypothetical protein